MQSTRCAILGVLVLLAGCSSGVIEHELPLRRGGSIVEKVRPRHGGVYTLTLELCEPTVVTAVVGVRWRVEREGTMTTAGFQDLRRTFDARWKERRQDIARLDLEEGVEHTITLTATGDVRSLAVLAPRIRLEDPTGGWSAFRARIGVGFGLGAHAQLSGLVHGGLVLGGFDEVGPTYHGCHSSETKIYCAFGLLHAHGTPGHPINPDHACWGLLPGPTASPEWDHGHPWAFEVGVALVFFDLQLGFDPETLLFR